MIATPRTLRFERMLRAPRERVFAAFVEPGKLRRWMCPDGFHVRETAADPRPGGDFRLVMVGPDETVYPVRGRYLEVRPPEFVAFTWTWEADHPMAGVETRISVALTAAGPDTRFVMTHAGFPDAGEADSHDGGWTQALAKLATFVEEETSL